MTEDEVVAALAKLPEVTAQTAGPDIGAPEVAWGDSFFFHDPGDGTADLRFPFATVVTQDYPGFDEASDLGRPGAFRVNLGIGRVAFEELFGYPPRSFAEHAGRYDFADADRLVPHPVYAPQAWVSVVVPGERTWAQVLRLAGVALDRARRAHDRAREVRDGAEPDVG